MYSLAAASRSRLSETVPMWFMFETSCYAFGGRIRRFAKLNVNKVNFVPLYRIYYSCKLFLSINTFNIIDNICIAKLGEHDSREKHTSAPFNWMVNSVGQVRPPREVTMDGVLQQLSIVAFGDRHCIEFLVSQK